MELLLTFPRCLAALLRGKNARDPCLGASNFRCDMLSRQRNPKGSVDEFMKLRVEVAQLSIGDGRGKFKVRRGKISKRLLSAVFQIVLKLSEAK